MKDEWHRKPLKIKYGAILEDILKLVLSSNKCTKSLPPTLRKVISYLCVRMAPNWNKTPLVLPHLYLNYTLLRDNVSLWIALSFDFAQSLNWTTANMNEMIINILTVGPSSIEITLPTGEMKSLKNWGMDLNGYLVFTINKWSSPMTIVKRNILDIRQPIQP